jgi:hypothetical protein
MVHSPIGIEKRETSLPSHAKSMEQTWFWRL